MGYKLPGKRLWPSHYRVVHDLDLEHLVRRLKEQIDSRQSERGKYDKELKRLIDEKVKLCGEKARLVDDLNRSINLTNKRLNNLIETLAPILGVDVKTAQDNETLLYSAAHSIKKRAEKGDKLEASLNEMALIFEYKKDIEKFGSYVQKKVASILEFQKTYLFLPPYIFEPHFDAIDIARRSLARYSIHRASEIGQLFYSIATLDSYVQDDCYGKDIYPITPTLLAIIGYGRTKIMIESLNERMAKKTENGKYKENMATENLYSAVQSAKTALKEKKLDITQFAQMCVENLEKDLATEIVKKTGNKLSF